MTQSLKLSLTLIVLVLVLNTPAKRRPRKPDHLKSQNFDFLYKTMIPEGCYGQKQLREILTHNTAAIKHKPVTPEWCSEDQLLIPYPWRSENPQASKSPYKIQAEKSKRSNNLFKVVLKSRKSPAVKDATVVARSIDNRGHLARNNRGRFIKSPGVQLICCSLTDKDVVRFTSDSDNANNAVFYWTPYEEVTEDFEGNITFIATVANSNNEYWTNVTSKKMRVISSGFQLFSLV